MLSRLKVFDKLKDFLDTYIMPKIELLGYLKGSRLDKEGAKTVSFEFSSKHSLDTAKIELMGRDLVNHLPVLLKVSVEIAKSDPKAKRVKKYTV